jgi:DNA-binding GntR family transcriptional regulator
MKVVRTTVAEGTAIALRSMILSGELRAGEALRQEDLAQRLGVSRTPLREAIARLDAEGLVVNDPHKGAVVCRPTLEEVLEGFEIQSALEPLAARLAAETRTEADVEVARELLEALERAKSPEVWAARNEAFHLGIYRMSRRPRLVDLIAKQYERSNLFVRILALSPDGRGPARAEREHTKMVKALERGDGDQIELLVREHVASTVRFTRAQFEAGKK